VLELKTRLDKAKARGDKWEKMYHDTSECDGCKRLQKSCQDWKQKYFRVKKHEKMAWEDVEIDSPRQKREIVEGTCLV